MYSLDTDGFQIFQRVFSTSEVSKMRSQIEKLFFRLTEAGLVTHVKTSDVDFKTYPADVIQKELECFNYIIFDDRILECVRNLLGPDFCYFKDSNIQVGTGHAGYHKDNVSRNNPNHSDWSSDYNVIRMGLYLQDTKNFSGGISIKKGSHLHVNLSSGKGVIPPLETGDVVFWKLTTTHSGNAKRLKFFPNTPLYGRIQRNLPGWLFKPTQVNRIALFATYGKPGIHTETFIDYLKTRTDSYLQSNSVYTEKARALANAGNFRLV